jgi:hypothetical protein
MAGPSDPQGEQRLVQLCLANDQAARNKLIRDYQPSLMQGIGSKLIFSGQDLGECEEIAAQFWLSILRDNWRGLLAFDPTRGQLATFMYVLGRQRASIWLRKKRREQRNLRSCPMDRLSDPRATIWPIESVFADLQVILSPRLQRFLQRYLEWPEAQLVEAYTPGQFRTLKHRLLRSVKRILGV